MTRDHRLAVLLTTLSLVSGVIAAYAGLWPLVLMGGFFAGASFVEFWT